MASVAVAADRLAAVLHLAAGETVTLAGLRDLLAAADVHHGLSRDALVAALVPTPAPRALTVAIGDAPEAGGDDAVERLIEDPEAGRGRWLVEVAPGTVLARVRRGRPPRAGRDVTGAELSAEPGRSADLSVLAGVGTAMREGDGPELVATIAGAYARDAGGTMSVRSPVTVPGDLDHACGDLDTGLPVVVKGDVTAGFSLVCGADATVGGTIEDARVRIGGDLTVGGGIVAGRQHITVHGRLAARHVMGRAISARVVALGGAAVDADLVVAETLTCTALIGGRAFVGREAVCDQLGDAGETATTVDLGGKAFLAALAHEAVAEHAAAQIAAGQLRERVHLLHHHLQQVLADEGLEAAGQAEEELRDAQALLAAHEAAGERCARIIARHEAALARDQTGLAKARLVVRKQVHPGAVIVFGSQRLVIDAPYGASTFRLVEGTLVRE